MRKVPIFTPDALNRHRPVHLRTPTCEGGREVTVMIIDTLHHHEIPDPAWILAKPFHILKARWLAWRIRRQRRDLAKYVRRSAYEINAWRQDIGFLDELRDYHLARAGKTPRALPVDGSKVVPMDQSGTVAPSQSVAS